MRKSLWVAGLLVLLLCAKPVSGDTLHYVGNGRLDTVVQDVVERETPIPILSHLLCEAKGNSVTLTATDQLSIGTSCEAKAFDFQRVPTQKDLLVSVNYETNDLWNYGFWVPLEFSNLSAGAEFGLKSFSGDLQLTQAQTFTGPDSAPVLSTGVFNLSNGTRVTVTSQFTSVPEPSTLLLFGTGLVGLWVFRRFKRPYRSVTHSWS